MFSLSAIQHILSRYLYAASAENHQLCIERQPPKAAAQVLYYIAAAVVVLVGLFVMFLKVRFSLYVGGVIASAGCMIAAQTWRKAHRVGVRQRKSLVLGPDALIFTEGFRSRRMPRAALHDITIRYRIEDRLNIATIYFVNLDGAQEESLDFSNLNRARLTQDMEQLCDQLFQFAKTATVAEDGIPAAPSNRTDDLEALV